MKGEKIEFKDIDAYIASQPEAVQPVLEHMRQIIRKAAPKAEETISYQMPAFKQHGVLVYFAGWKSHIGFYAVPSGVKAFEKDLAAYTVSKGTIQFPLDKPLPAALITKIVKFRVKENLEKEQQKKEAKKSAAPKPKSVKK
jgi:uncharacterized protein YdhG (YjbR/CyaY superfamily)